MKAPIPGNESERLKALSEYHILDSIPEDSFDDIVALASYIAQCPIALVSLVDRERQWFKARVGLDATETSRDLAFCAHAILDPSNVLEVQDATQDRRFADNPLVTGDPKIRFYAGAPLLSPQGLPLGTVCVIDRTPRTLLPEQRRALLALSRQVSTLLELRRVSAALAKALETVRTLEGFIPICASCKSIRDEGNHWAPLESYVAKHTSANLSHTICPACAAKLYPEFNLSSRQRPTASREPRS